LNEKMIKWGRSSSSSNLLFQRYAALFTHLFILSFTHW